MHKDDGNHHSWCKHSSNEYGRRQNNRRLINKRTRTRVKAKLNKDPETVRVSRLSDK